MASWGLVVSQYSLGGERQVLQNCSNRKAMITRRSSQTRMDQSFGKGGKASQVHDGDSKVRRGESVLEGAQKIPIFFLLRLSLESLKLEPRQRGGAR